VEVENVVRRDIIAVATPAIIVTILNIIAVSVMKRSIMD
jgi:hypothetical protein